MKNIVKTWFFSFVHLFFPRQCAVCGAILQEGEEGICMKCNMDMPRTNYHLRKDNPVERMFLGGRYLWNMPHLVSFTIKGVISAAFSIS